MSPSDGNADPGENEDGAATAQPQADQVGLSSPPWNLMVLDPSPVTKELLAPPILGLSITDSCD